MPRSPRYRSGQIQRDLARKMVILGGPRQVGKTTLARALPGGGRGYLNWDVADHRERILKGQLPVAPLWILDEIHKYRLWRRFASGPVSLPSAPPAFGRRAWTSQTLKASGSSPALGISRALLRGIRGRVEAVVARLPESPDPRRRHQPRAGPGPRNPRVADAAPS